MHVPMIRTMRAKPNHVMLRVINYRPTPTIVFEILGRRNVEVVLLQINDPWEILSQLRLGKRGLVMEMRRHRNIHVPKLVYMGLGGLVSWRLFLGTMA
jgi:hypothetical protein